MPWDHYHDEPGRSGRCPDCGAKMAAMSDENLECSCGWAEVDAWIQEEKEETEAA